MNCLLQWLYWNSYVNESLTVACRGKTHSIPSERNKKAVIQNLWCAYMHKSTLCICLLGCVYTASLNAQIRSFDHIQFFGPSVYIYFIHDWYPISVFTLIPAQKDCLQWSLYAHGRPSGFKWPCYYNYLFASMDNGCHGCFAAQNLTEWVKTGK